jgi:pyridoxal 5'-phosphate synthase / NAD(P)H-hydrate epimerase
VQVCYPKQPSKDLYKRLVVQCESLDIPVFTDMPGAEHIDEKYDVVLDAIFGFSFHGSIRSPFDSVVKSLCALSSTKVVSIDVPSGWNVEQGDSSDNGLRPDMLISLTAPKKCALNFTGDHHFLGGRFVPPAIRTKYNLKLPAYPGASQCVRISSSL